MIMGIVTMLAGCNFIGGARGSGAVKTESRPVAAFHQVSLGAAVDAEITTGPVAKLELTGDDNLLPLITTEVIGDKLEIRSHERMRPSQHLKAKIVVPALTALAVVGAGDVELSHIDADALAVSIAGSGDVHGTGRAHQLTVDVAGTGELRFAEFPVEQAKVNVSGTGDLELSVSQTLEANISGTGDITYHGDPRVTRNVSGRGDLKHK